MIIIVFGLFTFQYLNENAAEKRIKNLNTDCM